MNRCGAVLVGLLLVLLSGCSSPLVRPGQRVALKSFSLSSPIAWSQFSNGRERIWTLDGPMLNRVWMIDGVKPGEQVFLRPRPNGRRKGEGALFQAGISDSEAIDLIAAGLREQGIDNLRVRDIAPRPFGQRPGFAFALDFASRRGLRYRGFGAGEVADDTLSFVLFFAPAEHYYGRDLHAARQVIESIRSR